MIHECLLGEASGWGRRAGCWGGRSFSGAQLVMGETAQNGVHLAPSPSCSHNGAPAFPFYFRAYANLATTRQSPRLLTYSRVHLGHLGPIGRRRQRRLSGYPLSILVLVWDTLTTTLPPCRSISWLAATARLPALSNATCPLLQFQGPFPPSRHRAAHRRLQRGRTRRNWARAESELLCVGILPRCPSAPTCPLAPPSPESARL